MSSLVSIKRRIIKPSVGGKCQNYETVTQQIQNELRQTQLFWRKLSSFNMSTFNGVFDNTILAVGLRFNYCLSDTNKESITI